MNALFKLFFQSTPSTSSAGELSTLDWKKSLRMGAIVALGGAITALADYVSIHLAGWDFGAYKPFLVPVISYLLELARRWVTNNQIQ